MGEKAAISMAALCVLVNVISCTFQRIADKLGGWINNSPVLPSTVAVEAGRKITCGNELELRQ